MVKAYCRESMMIEEFEENNENFRAVATRALIWSGYLMPITNVINNLGYVAIAVVSGVMAAQGMISVGLISSFLLYSKQFTRPFVDIANIYNNFQTAVAGAERIFEVLDEQTRTGRQTGCSSPAPSQGAYPLLPCFLWLRAGSAGFKRYQSGNPSRNKRWAIVGHTGSGKTTFINLLTRFYDVTDGSIELDGHDLRDYKMADLRNAFGVVLPGYGSF